MSTAHAAPTPPTPRPLPPARDAGHPTLDAAYQALMDSGRTGAQIHDTVRAEIGERPVHIYGALGRAASLLIQRLRDAGLTIASGYDRRGDGSVGGAGFPVEASTGVTALRPDDVLILAAGSAQLIESMAAEVTRLTQGRPPRMIDGRKLTYLTQNAHCATLAERGAHEDLLTCISYHTKPFTCEHFKRATEKLAMREVPQVIKSEGAALNSVGYLVSEWCNLRCAQCCEAVPYLDSKDRVTTADVVADLTRLTASIKFLHRLDLVGGEPFAHKEITDIVRAVRALPGIGYIAVFTNGTIMPSDELCEALVSERIIVTNSDYSQSLDDNKRAKIVATVAKLRRFGVKVVQIADRYWFDLINFTPNGVDEARLASVYSECFLECCRRLHRGTLYHCTVQANGIKLGALEKANVVEIHDADPAVIAEQLSAFENERFIEACRNCALPAGAREVVAAQQLKLGEIPVVARRD